MSRYSYVQFSIKALSIAVLLLLATEDCSSFLYDKPVNCTDQHASCAFWADIYECLISPQFMMCECAVSCHTPNVCNEKYVEGTTLATDDNSTSSSTDVTTSDSTDVTTSASYDVTTSDNTDVTTSNDTDCQCRFVARLNMCYKSTIRQQCSTTCELRDAITCPEPEPHNLTYINPSHSTYHYIDKYRYACIEGYKNVGEDPDIICIENGTWVIARNLSLPTCVLKYCGRPPDVAHSTWNATHYYYNGTTNYTCDVGYVMTSSYTKLCDGSETWTGSVICEGVECGPPPSVLHSTFYTTSTRYPAVANYTCETGYNTTSLENVKVCSENATWNGIDIQCSIVTCGSPPTINNTDLSRDTLTYLSTANYTCVKGYNVTTGSDVKICKEDGIWHNDDLVCEIVSCGPAPDLENSTVRYDAVTYGSTATYSCFPGHKPEAGSDVRSCDEFGSWNGSNLVCTLVTCGNPPVIDHSCTCSNYTMTYLSLVNYTCDVGYEQVGGSDVKLCNGDGVWEGTSIVCQAKPSVAESIGIITNFEPKILEAEGSVGFGVAACVIMIVIIGAIVLLDLTTICQHVRFMKSNVEGFWDRQKFKFLCSPKVKEIKLRQNDDVTL